MKESTLIAIQKDNELLKKAVTRAIAQLDYQQQVLGGMIAALELMPEYKTALDTITKEAQKEIDEANKAKTELE